MPSYNHFSHENHLCRKSIFFYNFCKLWQQAVTTSENLSKVWTFVPLSANDVKLNDHSGIIIQKQQKHSQTKIPSPSLGLAHLMAHLALSNSSCWLVVATYCHTQNCFSYMVTLPRISNCPKAQLSWLWLRNHDARKRLYLKFIFKAPSKKSYTNKLSVLRIYLPTTIIYIYWNKKV